MLEEPGARGATLRTRSLALLAAVAALAFRASCTAQLLSRRRSLSVLAVSAAFVGAGHAVAFVTAQEEPDDIVPPERRGR